jgi:hypothetical protein
MKSRQSNGISILPFFRLNQPEWGYDFVVWKEEGGSEKGALIYSD